MERKYVLLLLLVVFIPLTYGKTVNNVLTLTNFKIMGLPSIEIVDKNTNSILQSSSSSFPPYLCFSTDCPEENIHLYEDDNLMNNVDLSEYRYRVGVYCLPYTLFYPNHEEGITQPAKKISFECDGKKDEIWYYVNINTHKEFSLAMPKQYLSNYKMAGNVIVANTSYLSVMAGEDIYFIVSSRDKDTGDIVPSSTVDLQMDEYEAYVLNLIDMNANIEQLQDLSGFNVSFTLPSKNMYMKSFYLSLSGRRTDDCLTSPSSCWGAYYRFIPLPLLFNTTIIGLESGEEASLNSTFNVLFDYTILDENAGDVRSVKVTLYGENASGKNIGVSLNNKMGTLHILSNYGGEYYLLTEVEHSNGNTYIYNHTFYVAPYYVRLNFTSSKYYVGDKVNVGVSLEDKSGERLSVDSIKLKLISENGSVVKVVPFGYSRLLADGEYLFSFTLPNEDGTYRVRAIVEKGDKRIVKEENIYVKSIVDSYYFNLSDAEGKAIEERNINLSIDHASTFHIYLHNLGKPFFLSFLNIDINQRGISYNISEYQGKGDEHLIDRGEVYDIGIIIDPLKLLVDYGPTGNISISFSVGDCKRRVVLYYYIDLGDKLTVSLSSPVVTLDRKGEGKLCMTIHNNLTNVVYDDISITLHGPLASYFSRVKDDIGMLRGGEKKEVCFRAHSSSTIYNKLIISLYVNGKWYKNMSEEVGLDKEIEDLLQRFNEVYDRFESYCSDKLDELYDIDNTTYADLEERCSLVKEEVEKSKEDMDKEEMKDMIEEMEAVIKGIDEAISSRTSPHSYLTLEELEAELNQLCREEVISKTNCFVINSSIEKLRLGGVYSQTDLLSIKRMIQDAVEKNVEEEEEKDEGDNKLLMALLFLAVLLVIGGVILFTSLVPDEEEQPQEEEEF